MKSNGNDFGESRELKTLLEEKFRQMTLESDAAPTELKKEVFNTLNSMILMGDLVDLFTVKFANTKMRFMDPSLSEDFDSIDDNLDE